VSLESTYIRVGFIELFAGFKVIAFEAMQWGSVIVRTNNRPVVIDLKGKKVLLQTTRKNKIPFIFNNIEAASSWQ